jgi:hypothetical protein
MILLITLASKAEYVLPRLQANIFGHASSIVQELYKPVTVSEV